MIRIARGVEPEGLQTERRRRLARAFLDHRAGREVVFEGYDVAREPLYLAQGQKCAYCERQQGKEGQPVEHFRPKGGVEGGDPVAYFWLAWTWNNLLFSCTTCNSRHNKGSKFPREEGTPHLPHPTIDDILEGHGLSFQSNLESPLLIDPCVDDPMDHIAWRPENPGEAPEKLRWRPMHRTLRGEETIRVLGLRTWLADQVSDYIRRHVLSRAKRVRDLLSSGDIPTAVQEWRDDILSNLFAPLLPYHAAVYDSLDVFFPLQERVLHGLDLPRPGRHGTVSLPDVKDSEKLALMRADVRLEVRAYRENAEDLVFLLCAQEPWTKRQLADAIGCSDGTVSTACRKLSADGRLKASGAGFVRA